MSAESNPSESNFTPGMLPGNPEDYGVVKPKPEEGYNLRTLNEAGDKADADFATGKITADEYSKILHDHLEKLPNVIDDKKRIKEDREMVERLVAEAKAKSAKAGEGSGVLDATVPKPETKPADTVSVASTETDPKIVTSEPHEEGSEVDPIGNVIKPPETEAPSAVVAPEPTPEAAPKPAVDAKKVEPVPEQEKPKEDEVAMRNRLREEAEKKFQAEVDKNPEALEKDNFLITGTNKYLKDLEWRKKRWPGIFNDAYSKLTPEEKDKFDVLPYKNKFLNKDQIGHLLVAGYSLEEIEKIKPHWWSNKVTSRLSDKPVYEEELNVLIWQAVNKKFEEQAKEDVGKIWDNHREKFIQDEVNAELQKIEQAKKLEEAKLEREKLIQAKKEVKAEKIKKAESWTPEERLKKIDKMNALYANIVKINRALRDSKVKVKNKDGKALSEDDLKTLLGRYSNDTVEIANELSGENFMAIAADKAGYDRKAEVKDEVKRKEFQRELTALVVSEFKKQVEIINDAEKAKGSKKRVGRKKKKVELPAAPVGEAIAPSTESVEEVERPQETASEL